MDEGRRMEVEAIRNINQRLDHIESQMDKLLESMTLLRVENAQLKVKQGSVATMFGLIGGVLSALTIWLIEVVRK